MQIKNVMRMTTSATYAKSSTGVANAMVWKTFGNAFVMSTVNADYRDYEDYKS